MARSRRRRSNRKSAGSTYSSRTQDNPGKNDKSDGVNFGKISRKLGTTPKIRAKHVANKAWKQNTKTRRPRFARPRVASVKSGSTLNANRGF